MGKSEKQKIGAAKSAARKISISTYSRTNQQGAPSKADKIIENEAIKREDTKRNTGAKTIKVKKEPNKASWVAPFTYVTKAENALARAAKVSAKTGENVQNVRSRIKTDVAKTAMRAKMIETRNNKKAAETRKNKKSK